MLLSIPCGGRAGLRNDKNESGCLLLIGLEGKVPLPRMPTPEREPARSWSRDEGPRSHCKDSEGELPFQAEGWRKPT